MSKGVFPLWSGFLEGLIQLFMCEIVSDLLLLGAFVFSAKTLIKLLIPLLDKGGFFPVNNSIILCLVLPKEFPLTLSMFGYFFKRFCTSFFTSSETFSFTSTSLVSALVAVLLYLSGIWL